MGFVKRKKVVEEEEEKLVSGVDEVSVGVGPPPVPSVENRAVEEKIDPVVEALVRDVQGRYGGLYGAGVSPGDALAAEQANLLVAVVAEVKESNRLLAELIKEVKEA